MILAFEIKYPWWKYRPWPNKIRYSEDPKFDWRRMNDIQKKGLDAFWREGYRETFISIWHVDPETDGSDDSCGYSYPRITKEQRYRLKNAAWSEAHTPHFLTCKAKEWTGTVAEAECLYRGLLLLVIRVLRLKFSMDEVTRYAAEAMHIRSCSKAGDIFCYLPGYHSNSKEDTTSWREDHFFGIMCGVARGLLDAKRPWWKHPKWHFWHWKFQCIPLQSFKRMAFSKCCKCGGRFRYGESCVTNNWNSEGPKWFRTEPDIMCEKCSGPVGACDVKTNEAANASN